MFIGKEVPDHLRLPEYIDISNEDYMKIQCLFTMQPERLSEKTPKGDAIV